jgi:hypothetical protein
MKKCNDLNNDVSEAALTRAAREAVAGALAGDFPIDPLIGKDLSRALSCIGSVVKRHGTLIELGIAGALVAGERFIVLPNVAIPLTKAALQLLDAKNTDETLSKIKLSADSEADGIVNVDLVVVDPEAGWAGAYEIKRGNGATEHGKRRPIIRRLRAVRLVLASFVDQLGYGPIKTATSAVIDYYGASGFDAHFTITRHQIDEHFDVPVVAMVDAMTKAARDALEVELPALFEPVFEQMTQPEEHAPALPNPGTSTVGKFVATAATVLRVTTAAPVGPGRRQPKSHQVRH